jgi:hypothetical protein
MRVPGISLQISDRNKNAIAFDSDRISFDVFGQRRTRSLTGSDVELSLVERAFDFMALKKSVTKSGIAMRANIVSGIDCAIDLIQGDTFSGHVDTNDIIGRKIISSCNIDPVITHVFIPQIG